MQNPETPRRFRIFESMEDEGPQYSYGCFFTSTGIITYEFGESVDVSEKDFEWPTSIEWLDEECREDLEIQVFALTEKLEALIQHVGYEPEPFICDGCQD